MTKFNKVIVRKPGKSYVEGLTTSNIGTPEYELLLDQHEDYVKALKKTGVTVEYLESDERYPDSTFVEDTAVLTHDFAIICNPGADTRNDEKNLIEPVIKKDFEKMYYIEAPGTVDGGDVLQADDKFYIGISERTNKEGARQFKNIVESEGYTASIVPLKEFFHLKTGIAYLGDNNMLVAGEFIDHPEFESYNQISVDNDEVYAANCIRVNDYVFVPSGFNKVIAQLDSLGYNVLPLQMSEFQKQDGGLSCLSLRY